jgi:hypothetical protein
VLQSHTATQQWQSFEMRMRRRRVERCLLRASVAIEAGVLDDAREAIDEIRLLDPAEPGLEQLTAQLADAENPKPVEREFPPLAAPEHAAPRRHRLAAAAALLACSLAGGWWWTSRLSTSVVVQKAVSSTQQANQPVTKPGPDPFVGVSQTSVTVPISGESRPIGENPLATSGTAPSANAEAEVRPSEVTETPSAVVAPASIRIPAADPVQDSPANARSDERPTLAEDRSSAVSPAPASAPVIAPPPAAPAASARLEPLTGLPETAPATPRVVAGAEGIAAPEAAARSAETLTALPSPPSSEPATTTRSEEQSVRGALGRYESAYNRLDAAAAAGVWPTVNQRALASAFHGLSAQAISLGDCQIRVNGVSAHADCAGNARWTPKVGGGTQSAARQWRFDLRNSGGSWVITQATTR